MSTGSKKAFFRVGLLSFFAGLLFGGVSFGHPMNFPGAGWEKCRPEEQDVDSAKLQEAVDYLEAHCGSDGVSQLVIVRNGAMIYEGDNIDKKHGVWSMTKSFTSTVLGLLIDEGKVTVNARAKDYVPRMGERFSDVTLEHFTTMTSGYRAVGDEPKGSYSHGPSSTPFTPGVPLFAPGQKYAYWDSAMNQFANVLTRIAGEKIEDLFGRKVADVIGMDRSAWDWGEFGKVDGLIVNGGSGNSGRHMIISARQMARFGHLFLNRGMWDGQRVISAEWVDAATRNHVPATMPPGHMKSDIDGAGVYGYNWWINGVKSDGRRMWPGAPVGTYAASGYNNNKMFVVPEWRMVIVRLGLDAADGEITPVVYAQFLEKVGQAITGAKGPLRVHEQNPNYFTDGTGRAVYLTGSHMWNNIIDMGKSEPPEKFDYDGYLDWMQKLNHNFIRLWTWESVTWNTENLRKAVNRVYPQPWVRTGEGKANDGKMQYDLSKFDEEYFGRLRRRVTEASKRDIYVSIMLFEGWAMQFSPGAWEAHPFHPNNNVNGIDGDVDKDGMGLDIHELANKKVTALQEAYVRKVIDTVNEFDNVLYEISNENHPASTPWQYHMIRFIKDYEKTKPKQHAVGMTFQYKGGSNEVLFESPADWISPNPQGGYRDNPPPADGRKVVLLDTDHLWGIGGNQAWVWKSFLRGYNPLFMDPYDGLILGNRFDPQWEPIRRSLGYTRYYAEKINLSRMLPVTGLASTKYCLAEPGAEYLVYRPAVSGESFTVKLKAGVYELEWFDPAKGAVVKRDTITVGDGDRSFKPSFNGDAVLYLVSKGQ